MGKVNASSSWVRRSCIGRGSYGSVSLAVNKLDGRVFAAKSVDLTSCFRSQIEALDNEIRILRSISSPWVVEYIGDDVTVEDGATSFRNLHMEYLPGGTAADLANGSAADVDEKTVRSYTWCVVSALRHVHSVGILHCDVKGRNVLVGATPGAAKLSDFGSATEFADAGPPRGSPLWMAPEVIRGEYQGPESDVWSLGCTVIEMITGRPAWEDHGADTLFQIGYSDKLPELPTQLSEHGRDFLDKCLRRDRTERWSCDQLLRHPFISSSAPPNSITRQSPRCVLDCLNSEFCDDDDDVEKDQSTTVSESAAHSGRDRIAKLASNARAIWESDGWVTVRDVISDKEESASNACSSGDEDEGTSSEYRNFTRTEREMEGTSSEYSDTMENERTNSGYSNYGDGVTAERVDRGGGRWRGVGAGSNCRYGLREWNWAVDFGPQGNPAGVIFLLKNLFDFTAILLCNSLWCIIIHMLFTFYSRFQSVHVT